MRLLWIKICKGCFFAMVIASMSFTIAEVSYSGTIDGYHRGIRRGPYIMAPGYIRRDEEKTAETLEQVHPKEGSLDATIEYIKNKLGDRLAEDTIDRVILELKKKTSTTESTATSEAMLLIDSANYNVAIGTGTNQTFDENGRLITEEINGKRHVYAGFESVGYETIQGAINSAEAGNIVIVSAGTYTEELIVKDGIMLYGGYAEDGTRGVNTTTTTIKGTVNATNIERFTEVNGFYIRSGTTGGNLLDVSGSSDQLFIRYNSIIGGFRGIFASDGSKAVIENNSIARSIGGIVTINSSLTIKNNIIGTTGQSPIMEGSGSASVITNNLIGSFRSGTLMDLLMGFIYPPIICSEGAHTTIERNTIFGNWYAIRIYDTNTTIKDNVMVGLFTDILLADVPIGSLFRGTPIDINAQGPSGIGEGNIYEQDGFFIIPLIIMGMPFGYIPVGNTDYDGPDIYPGKGYSTDNISPIYLPFETASSSPRVTRLDTSPYNYLRDTQPYNRYTPYSFSSDFFVSIDKNLTNPPSGKKIADIFKGLFANKELIYGEDEIDKESIALYLQKLFDTYAISVPLDMTDAESQEMRIALLLANMLKNPTEEERVMIDTVAALMKEVKDVENETGNGEIQKASDGLVEMVAIILVAQAMPGLLKEADIASVKEIFMELNEEKSKILLEYQNAVNMYYNNTVKEIVANRITLQIKDLLPLDITDKEIEEFPRARIDEILGKIRNAKDKTYTEEYILSREAEWKERYSVTAKKILEENMRLLIGSFTQRLVDILNNTGLLEEETVDGKPIVKIDLSKK